MFLSKDKFYRIDSVSPDLSKAFLSTIDSTQMGVDVVLFAPLIDFTDTKGNNVSSKTNAGKYVLLDFMGSWCVPCIAALPALKTIYNSYKSKIPFEMISVAVEHEDNRPKFDAFLKKHNIPWPVIYQPAIGRKMSDLKSVEFGVQGYPTYFLLDKDGRIVIRGTGNDTLLSIEKKLTEVQEPR